MIIDVKHETSNGPGGIIKPRWGHLDLSSQTEPSEVQMNIFE